MNSTNGNTTYTVSHKHNIAFYDSEKNYISGIEQNQTSATGTIFTFTTPSNARYIRLSIKDAYLKHFSFNKGNNYGHKFQKGNTIGRRFKKGFKYDKEFWEKYRRGEVSLP